MGRRALLLLVLATGLAPLARGCNVPVFRFALEHWAADPWVLAVPAEGRRAWEEALAPRSANLHADVSTGATARLAAPAVDSGKELAWDLASPRDLVAFLEEPFKKEVVRRLLAGDSTVFVVVGPPAAAEKVAARVDERLRYLESVIALPELDQSNPDDALRIHVPLRLRFSTLIVPAEPDGPRSLALRALAETALGATVMAPELAASEVFVYPIFGRGRVLAAVPVNDDLEFTLDGVCTFLTSACSCQVKQANPGVDLLLDVNWEAEFARLAKTAPAPAAAPTTSPDGGRFTGDTGAPESVTFGPQ